MGGGSGHDRGEGLRGAYEALAGRGSRCLGCGRLREADTVAFGKGEGDDGARESREGSDMRLVRGGNAGSVGYSSFPVYEYGRGFMGILDRGVGEARLDVDA